MLGERPASGVSVLAFASIGTRSLLASLNARLAGQYMSRSYPLSACSLGMGAPVFQMCAHTPALCGFVGAKQVLTLARQML